MSRINEKILLFLGPVVHSTSQNELNILLNAALVVKNGKIVFLDTFISSSEIVESIQKKYEVTVTYELQSGQFLMPGLVDTHIHAPQYPNIGLGYDKALLEWLETYTFPLECQYGDIDFATKVYAAVVKRTLKAGTTTACYFATIHEESSLLLARLTTKFGQRALVGKVNMNVNHPPNYGETTQQSISSTESFIKSVLALNNPLVKPIITPRFAITCDTELMNSLGELAKKYDVHVQTHISENQGEIAAVKEIFPDSKNYADVYDKSNLLTNKTVLAHGVYLEDEELALLAKKGTSVSHCPNSNVSLQSGICDVRRLLANNIKVGLGTDCSGGYGHSLMDSMRQCLTVSTCLSFSKKDLKPLNYQEAFYLATLGGAQALALDSTIGNFTVGKEFDALVIDMNNGPSELMKDDYSIAELVQKFVYLADDRNISQIYVAGKLIST